MIKRLLNYFWPYSLKFRLIIVLVLISMFILALMGSLSHYSIHSIQKNKIQDGIYSSLTQQRTSIENLLNNLNYTSQQLAFDGGVGADVLKFLTTDKPFEKAELSDRIETNLRLINFTNPQLGLMLYYLPNENKRMLFETLTVRPDINLENLPLIIQQGGTSFYGPHKTFYRYGNSIVFSIIRKVSASRDYDIYVYIESNYKMLNDLLTAKLYGMDSTHFILDSQNKIVFSQDSTNFPTGMTFALGIPTTGYKKYESYYLFGSTSDQQWTIVTAVKKSDYNREISKWAEQFVFLGIISLIVSFIFALVIWRTLYRPINVFSKEIQLVSENQFHSLTQHTHNKEFDELLSNFNNMRDKILTLIKDVEEKERFKRHLEVEKLLYQINPHFLYNTLESVKWLAIMNNQTDIEKLISSMSRLLQYNLGKNGRIVSVRDELEALQDYITIQKMCRETDIEVEIKCEPGTMDILMPRFVLQPLVENAIYHGIKGEGEISIQIRKVQNGFAEIIIADDGEGMEQEELNGIECKILPKNNRKGMGIGLNYVKSMLEQYYGEHAEMRLYSKKMKGTTVVLKIPVDIGGAI